jgi:hypothetical protein
MDTSKITARHDGGATVRLLDDSGAVEIAVVTVSAGNGTPATAAEIAAWLAFLVNTDEPA